MRKKTMLKIGEFSQMMQVTVKTLRHYEQKGLLFPCEVDERTGYRYYSVEQMQRLNTKRNYKVSVSRLTKSRSCTKKDTRPKCRATEREDRKDGTTTAIIGGTTQSVGQLGECSQKN